MQAPAGRTLDVDALTVRYGSAVAVDGVSISIEPGEVVALLGPSGCGKTTLLRVIAGFVRQASGRVMVDGAAIDHLPANQRNVGIVFQNYALFPHISVMENVAYGLRARGQREGVAERVGRMLDMVQLGAFRDRLPRQLSGGQQQRVALARALAVEPSILLLDEPFAALDRNLRLDMQIEVKRLQRQLGLTTILVTHDQDEAMSVADRIAVMNKGKVEQFDMPVSIYDQPRTLFVNGFIGTTNLLPGRVTAVEDQSTTVALDAGGVVRVVGTPALAVGEGAFLSVRPEQLFLSATAVAGSWPIEPGLSLPLGAQLVHEARTRDGLALKIVESRRRGIASSPRTFCVLVPDARPTLFPRSTLPTPE